MIDYESYAKIHHLHDREGLNPTQIARALAIDSRTVVYWLSQSRFRPRQPSIRPSKLDPYKPMIKRLLEQHPYSAVQIFGRLREQGYEGAITILRDYLQIVRPPRRAPAFLTLAFAPGECAQVDACGKPHVGPVRLGERRQHPPTAQLLRHGALL